MTKKRRMDRKEKVSVECQIAMDTIKRKKI